MFVYLNKANDFFPSPRSWANNFRPCACYFPEGEESQVKGNNLLIIKLPLRRGVQWRNSVCCQGKILFADLTVHLFLGGQAAGTFN